MTAASYFYFKSNAECIFYWNKPLSLRECYSHYSKLKQSGTEYSTLKQNLKTNETLN